jgi:endonuclease/exonuclease/phosphatase family metal-dependent hydrolase
MLSRFLRLGPIVVALVAGVSACGQDGETTQVSTTSSTSTTGSGGAGHGGAGGAGGAAPVEPKPLTVMNWNVKNFFNDKKDSGIQDEMVPTTAQYQQKLAAVGAVIRAMNPDVVVLQEVENLAVLEDLNASQLGGGYGTRVLIDANDPRGIDIGALSKLPLGEAISHKDELFSLVGTNGPNYSYARDCLELRLTFNGRRLALLGVHWLSKATPNSEDKRLAEAQHTRAIADALTDADPKLGVIVLGDFNDLPDSPPYLAAKGQAPTEYGDAPDAVASEDRWTLPFNGEHQLVDHQLSNPLLYGMIDPSRVAIRHGADVDAASDHAPVSATYSVR